MGRREPELAQQPGRVARHVGEGVEHRVDLARDQLARGRRPSLDPGGPPDVAIVEADDLKAAPGERGAELIGPADHLGGQPHDQQHRRIGGVAEPLVAQGDAAADVAELLSELAHQLL